MSELGPLANLVGIWEGGKGEDVSPNPDRGVGKIRFRERMEFEETGPVDNHEQLLYGLRYRTTAWPEGGNNPFHEELGYWLWDAKEKLVMRCFLVPRGVTILAGGTVEPDAKMMRLTASHGSDTFGLCANPFLKAQFQPTNYLFTLEWLGPDAFRYFEVTDLKMPGRSEDFAHSDGNSMHRITS